MGDVIETIIPLGEGQVKSDRVAIINSVLKGTFLADDTDNHDFRFKGVGKGRMTVGIDNASDKVVTWALYGSFDEDGNVGDDDIFPITTGETLAAASKEYEVCNDPFPFYLARATVATGADGSTVSIFIYLAAF